MIQGSLLMLWMDENMSQQSNEKSLTKESLQLIFDSTTKQARIEAGALNRFGNTDVFCFGFYFMSPKWTRTKLMIVITRSLQRPNDAYHLYRGVMGSSARILKFLL